MPFFVRSPAALAGARPSIAGGHRQLISVLLFPITIAALLVVVYVGVTLLSGVRAYVGGESLWSKGQKAAVHSLYRFAITRDEADYERYIDRLAVPMADRRARLELQKPNPDVAYAVRSFIEGKNHPEDSKHLVLLFRYFGDVSYMRRAIEIWMAGDAKIDELDHAARRMHELVRSGVADPARYREVLDHIDRIDHDLTALEAEFSTTLGAGGRWLRWVVLTVVVLTGAILAWIGTAIWQQLLRQERAGRAGGPRLGRVERGRGGGPVRRAIGRHRRYGTVARVATYLRGANARLPAAHRYGARRSVIQHSRSPNTSSRPRSAKRAW